MHICVCLYVYVCVSTCVCEWVLVWLCVYMWVYVCVRVRGYMFVCLYVSACVYKRVCGWESVYMCVCACRFMHFTFTYNQTSGVLPACSIACVRVVCVMSKNRTRHRVHHLWPPNPISTSAPIIIFVATAHRILDLYKT